MTTESIHVAYIFELLSTINWHTFPFQKGKDFIKMSQYLKVKVGVLPYPKALLPCLNTISISVNFLKHVVFSFFTISNIIIFM